MTDASEDRRNYLSGERRLLEIAEKLRADARALRAEARKNMRQAVEMANRVKAMYEARQGRQK